MPTGVAERHEDTSCGCDAQVGKKPALPANPNASGSYTQFDSSPSTVRHMARIFGIAALLTFALGTIVHVATYVVSSGLSMDQVWPLHLASMAVLVPMVLSLTRQLQRHPKPVVTGLFATWRAAKRQKKEFNAKLVATVPPALRITCIVAGIYALANFVAFIVLMEGGGPSVREGKYVLHDHGRKIRDLSKAEYDQLRVYQVRGCSGHWMVFSIVSMTYFLAVHPKLQSRPELDADDAQNDTPR